MKKLSNQQILEEAVNRQKLAFMLLKCVGIACLLVTGATILVFNASKIEGERYFRGKFINYRSSDIILLGKEYIVVEVNNQVEEIPVKTSEQRLIAINAGKGDIICLHESNFSLISFVNKVDCY